MVVNTQAGLNTEYTYIIAACVAGELYRATLIAKKLTLIAVNARAVAARAGRQAVGFKAITNFIDEMANNTIVSAMSISQIGDQIAKISVTQLRAEDAVSRFSRAYQLCRDVDGSASVQALQHKAQYQVEDCQTQLNTKILILRGALDDAEKQVRAADAIVSMSKVEATRAGEYQEKLNVIAVEILKLAGKIMIHLQQAKGLLSGQL